MIRIHCNKADAILKETQTLTAGMANYPEVQLTFSDDWAGLGKAAVVRAGTVVKDVVIVNNGFTVPAECFANPGVNLIIGINGVGDIGLPTVWCACGEILDGTDIDEADNVGTPTQELVTQLRIYAEDANTAANNALANIIRSVEVALDHAGDYGTPSVESTLTTDAEHGGKKLTLTFGYLRGNGIDSFTIASDGTVQVRLTDGTVTNYNGLKEALEDISALIASVESAEATRTANETSRISAETSRVNAENARELAEEGREDAEDDRVSAESSRVSAESGRVTAETGRLSAETARASAESSRVSAENSRASAETARSNAETGRVSAETSRANAESTRSANETTRATNEATRINSENSRVSAETARASAESARASAETTRVGNETSRVSAETLRNSAESARVSAEESRAEEFASWEDIIEGVNVFVADYDVTTFAEVRTAAMAGKSLFCRMPSTSSGSGNVDNKEQILPLANADKTLLLPVGSVYTSFCFSGIATTETGLGARIKGKTINVTLDSRGWSQQEVQIPAEDVVYDSLFGTTVLEKLTQQSQQIAKIESDIAEAYDETATYSAGDYAMFDGILKKYNGTVWTAVKVTDEMGSGGGISNEAAELIITILSAGVYTSDQHSNISALRDALHIVYVTRDGSTLIIRNVPQITSVIQAGKTITLN